jgi:hypothetical protein
MGAIPVSGPEKVAVRVGDQPGLGTGAIGTIEADQRHWRAGVDRRSDRAGILDLEHCAVVVGATP